MIANKTGVAAAEPNRNGSLCQPGTVLTTIPQTVFGAKTLLEGRSGAFQADISKLFSMTLDEYESGSDGQSSQQAGSEGDSD